VTAATTVRPGALTALLGELARAPEATGWSLPAVPGERIGRFEVVREIGRGGFGVVYEAKDTELGRSVAFKAISAGSSDAVREQRALAEAEAAARLAHPNIVHLYDVGRCERGPFLIMELLRGESLDERLARGAIELRDAVHVAVEISRGLAHAHEQAVVHRDLKPGNVFLCDDGQVKVLDFGLAHVFERRGPDGGTPEYMAPEQARGEPSDERADVYALGVILHELLTGSRPAAPGSSPLPPRTTFFPLPPRQRGEKVRVRGALSSIVSRMLAQDPAERPANAAQVHAQLASIQRSLEPRRLPWAGAAIAAAAILGAGLFAWLWQRPLPPGRLLVAMTDTANATGDPDLDGVSELLRTGIEQSERISIMARSRIVNALRDTGEPVPRVIDEARIRQVAPRAQAQVLIVPTVRRDGPLYELSVVAVDLARDASLFTTRQAMAAKGSLRQTIDVLALEVRTSLGEVTDGAPRRTVSATDIAPGSAEAWSRYAEGQRLESEGKYADAAAAYERAAALDPGFPLPLLALFEQQVWGWGPKLRPDQLDALRRDIDRLPPKDRSYAENLLAEADEDGNGIADLRAALEHDEQQIRAWPEDPRGYLGAAWVLLVVHGDAQAARPYVDKASLLAPPSKHQVIDYLLLLDRVDEALARARRWTEETPSWLSFVNLAEVHRVRGETSAALDAARRALALASEPGPLALVFADAGQIEDFEVAVRKSRNWPRWLFLRGKAREALAAFGEGPSALWGRAKVAFARGDAAGVWRAAEDHFRSGGPTSEPPLFCHAWLLAALGELDRATLLATLWTPRQHVCMRAYRLLRQWKTGDREGALRGLASLSLASAHLYRGEILSELGRDREAVEELRRSRRSAENPFEHLVRAPNYTRSLYLEAAALERLGEREEARRVLDCLLRLWERADPDLPLLAEARALRARLGGRSP
jgi:tetratricopeptide (TPR) repeat protein